MQRRKSFFLLVLLFLGVACNVHAHEINPKVIEALTGEKIEHHHQDADTVADPRDESRTFYSFPEWYIVYSAQEYGSFVSNGNQPSTFPYFAAIGQMWEAWRNAEVAAGVPPDATTNTILWTIAVSFSIEYGIIGFYENTVGRVSELLHFNQKTIEDRYVDTEAVAYGDFLNQTPWYLYPYGEALAGLWQTYGWSSLSPRGIERRIAYTVGYTAKAGYAALIRTLSAASFEGGAGQTTTSIVQTPEEVLEGTDLTFAAVDGGYEVQFPRYRAFRDPAVLLAHAGSSFISIEGHDVIAVSFVAPTDFSCSGFTAPRTFALPLVTNTAMARHVFSVPVPQLGETIRALSGCSLTVEHLYDY